MEEEGTKQVEVQQFAKKVHHYSSQYGSETSISYTVTNLAGMCTKYPHYGDFTQACVFEEMNGGKDYTKPNAFTVPDGQPLDLTQDGQQALDLSTNADNLIMVEQDPSFFEDYSKTVDQWFNEDKTREPTLIDLWEDHDALYNFRSKNYMVTEDKPSMMKKFAMILHVPPHIIETRMASLRNQYQRLHRELPSGSEGPIGKTPRQRELLNVLHFLSDHIKKSASLTNYKCKNVVGVKNVQDGEVAGPSRSTPRKPKRTYGPWWRNAPSAPKPFARLPKSFNSVDYVELFFSEGVIPQAIEIFETYNPGAVVRILAYVHLKHPSRCSSEYEASWVTLWNGLPEEAPHESRIFSPPLKKIPYPTNLLRLELNSVLCHYYTELDGVRLTGLTTQSPLPELDIDGLCETPPDYETALREYGTPVDPFPFPGTSGYEDTGDDPNHTVDAESVRTSVPLDTTSETCKTQPTADNEASAVGDNRSNADTAAKSCSESLVHDLSRLHLTDGLVAALDPSNNGYFDLLPGEVIQGILSYLDVVALCSLAQTCRLLQQHCYDPLQFTELSLQPFWSMISDDVLNGLRTRCRFLQRLSLSWSGGYRTITPDCLIGFLKVCGSNLTTLHMASCRFLNDTNLATIAKVLPKYCPLLEDVDLQSNKTIFTGAGYRELSGLKNLRRLNLYRTYIDAASMIAIIRGCHMLESLNLGSCGSLNEIDIIAIELSINCKQLKHLDLWRARSLTETGLRAISKNCPDLEELDVGWCPNLRSGTAIFVELAQNCRKLKKLYLTANRTICDADLNALALHCKDLEQLDILGTREVSPKFTRKVLEHCGHLRLLDVSFCAGITPDVVTAWQHLYPHVNIKRSFQT